MMKGTALKLKKALSLTFAILTFITGISNGLQFDFAAFADGGLNNSVIANYDFGNPDYVNYNSTSDCTVRDSVNGAVITSHSWNPSAGAFNSGSDIFNQNGYLCGDLGAVAGKDSYRIDFKISKETDEATTALVIALGTSATATDITESGTADVFSLYQDGRLFVCGADKGGFSELALPTDNEQIVYSISFDEESGYLFIYVNGALSYSQSVGADEISAFKNVHFVSLGTQASDTSYGYYVGAISCHYYYLRASVEENYSETTDRITVDPVIYTHGDKIIDGIDYGYMMYGREISDGTVEGELSTTFKLPQGATVQEISCDDATDIGFEYAQGSYRITGSFDSDVFSVTDGEQHYTDLRFKYTYNSETYIETHRFSVKTNPVPTHGMIYAQAYTTITAGNKAAVSFQTAALGSVGSLEQSKANSSAWSGSVSHTYRTNSWNIYAPYDSAHNATDSSNGSLTNALAGKSDSSSTVDKVAGYGVTGSKNSIGSGSNASDIGAETEIAQYYVDKSADSILGAKHNAGESEYSIDILTENIYQSFNTSNGTVHIVQHEFNATEGSLDLQINSNWSQEDGYWKWYDAWNNNQRGSETAVLKGSTDNGNTSGAFWIAGYNYNGKQAKATIILNINIHVFDKTAARNVYSENTAQFDSKYYDTKNWEEYKQSKLELEALLGNYEISDIPLNYQNELETAYENLGAVCDYSALIAAIQQSKAAIDNAGIYKNTNALKEEYESVLSRAFFDDEANAEDITDINGWSQKIHEQAEVDNITRSLQFAYTEATLNKGNVNIKFSVYLDGVIVAQKEYHSVYKESITLNATELYPDAEKYEISKWAMGGLTVAVSGFSYTYAPKVNADIACYLISAPQISDAKCRVTLLDYSSRVEMVFYLDRTDTYATVISNAQKYSDEVLYYGIAGWEIDGSEDFDPADNLTDKEKITVRPIYQPTVNDYKIVVSDGNLQTENNFVFDAHAYINVDEERLSGDFLCWAVKYDDEIYRVASYNKEYSFYVSGNMNFAAITTENYNRFANQLQKNTTENDKNPAVPSLEDLKNKKPIPSLRGISEDAGSINGAVWNPTEHKLYVIGQVADGSEYDSCGTVVMYDGKTLVSPSVSQTDSGQYMITYRLSPSFSERKYSILAYSKIGEEGENIMYSPAAEITIPADEPVITVGNGTTVLKYNSLSGRYSVSQNGEEILGNAAAEFRIGSDGSILDVTSYDTHTATEEKISDSVGSGIQLNVVSKKTGLPIVEQTFKVYDNKDYILTDLSIKYENSGEIKSNYMAPLAVTDHKSFMGGNAPWTTFLYTPIDNDSWSQFLNYSLSATDNVTSHEVSAIYNPQSKEGLIVGAVTHDQWKSGVSYEGSPAYGISALRAFGGADTIEISSQNTYRGETRHGAVKGETVKSPTIFIGNYADWQNGMMEFTASNTAITPMRQEGDLGGVPFGWNSWGSIAEYLTTDNAINNINYIKDHFQKNWETDENGVADGTPVVMNLDSWWNEIKLNDSNEEAIKAFIAQCKANGQIPGVYHTPFTSWASESQMNDENESWWTHPERVLRKSDGTMYDAIDGGYPLDVTREDVIQETINRIKQFKEWGFEYVKLDFMGHGYLEGQFSNPDITTGAEAYNYAMTRILEEVNKDYGTQMFINLSIAPIFPYQYANGRRMGCDSWYSTEDTQYTLNQLTYGFWERGIYKYPDPDHAVIYGRGGDATQAQAKNVMTLNAAVAGNMLLGDSFVEYQYKTTIVGIEVTRTYNPSGAINMADNVLWNKDIIAMAKKNKTFRSVTSDTPQYANVYTMEDNGDVYFAVFNFSGNNTYMLDIPNDGYYECKELWSGEIIRDETWDWIDVQLSGEDSKIYKFTKVRDF